MEKVAVDIGYGYVKAISSSGNRVLFPSLVGKGYDRNFADLFGQTQNPLADMHIRLDGEDYFIGELTKESRSASRIFERERFTHPYTQILLNAAIQAVTSENDVWLATGLPLDFYQAQAKAFQETVTGIHRELEWRSGPVKRTKRSVTVHQALIFPQGASAIFSALVNHEGNHRYPQLMHEGALIGLIDIGFRTTDFVVIEIQSNGSFLPKARLSGTAEEGIINLHRDIRQAFKLETGGADLTEFFISRILHNEEIMYKGKQIDFRESMRKSKQSIAANIADRLKSVWAEETDLFEGLFLAGGGGDVFKSFLQPLFEGRLISIEESQFANAIGYLRLGKTMFTQNSAQNMR